MMKSATHVILCFLFFSSIWASDIEANEEVKEEEPKKVRGIIHERNRNGYTVPRKADTLTWPEIQFLRFAHDIPFPFAKEGDWCVGHPVQPYYEDRRDELTKDKICEPSMHCVNGRCECFPNFGLFYDGSCINGFLSEGIACKKKPHLPFHQTCKEELICLGGFCTRISDYYSF